MSTPGVNSTSSQAFHIYDFDVEQSKGYAEAMQVAESFRSLGAANVAHINAWVSDVRPRDNWLDSLQERGVVAWASTRPPPNWHNQRRDLFSNSLALSMGSDHEIAVNRAKIESMDISEESEELSSQEDGVSSALHSKKQREGIVSLFDMIKDLSDQIRSIRARMGQFVGG